MNEKKPKPSPGRPEERLVIEEEPEEALQQLFKPKPTDEEDDSEEDGET